MNAFIYCHFLRNQKIISGFNKGLNSPPEGSLRGREELWSRGSVRVGDRLEDGGSFAYRNRQNQHQKCPEVSGSHSWNRAKSINSFRCVYSIHTYISSMWCKLWKSRVSDRGKDRTQSGRDSERVGQWCRVYGRDDYCVVWESTEGMKRVKTLREAKERDRQLVYWALLIFSISFLVGMGFIDFWLRPHQGMEAHT